MTNKEFVFCMLMIVFLIGTFIACVVWFESHIKENTKVLAEGTGQFEIVGINPPKHFYVDLKEIATGKIHKRIFVSKHFNSWRKITIGTKIELSWQDIQYFDNEPYRKFDIYNALRTLVGQ